MLHRLKSTGRTALQAACEKGNLELIQLLLDVGADVNASPAEEYGRTALQAACEKGISSLSSFYLVLVLISMLCLLNHMEEQHYK